MRREFHCRVTGANRSRKFWGARCRACALVCALSQGAAAAEASLTGRRSTPRLAQLSVSGAEDLAGLIDAAVSRVRPLVSGCMRLLPDLAELFAELLRGQVHHTLVWLACTVETIGDPVAQRRPGGSLAARRRSSATAARTGALAQGGAGGGGAAGDDAPPPVVNGHEEAPPTRAAMDVPPLRGRRVDTNPTYVVVVAAVLRAFAESGVARVIGNAAAEPQARAAAEAEGLGVLVDVPDLVRPSPALLLLHLVLTISLPCFLPLRGSRQIKRVDCASRALVARYVSLEGERIAAMVRKSIDTADWVNMKEPRDARMVVSLVVDECVAMRRAAAAALAEDLPSMAAAAEAANSAAAQERAGNVGSVRRSDQGLQLDIDRLFSKRASTYPVIAAGLEPSLGVICKWRVAAVSIVADHAVCGDDPSQRVECFALHSRPFPSACACAPSGPAVSTRCRWTLRCSTLRCRASLTTRAAWRRRWRTLLRLPRIAVPPAWNPWRRVW